MHVVLDLQACQSPEGRRRGIGRYSLALAKAIAADPREHEITILLNAAMGESIEFLRGQFDGYLSQDRLVTWESLCPTAYIDPGNAFRMRASEALRTQVLRELNPDVVHVASLFDGWGDDVPDGKITDFRRAVQATVDETVVFGWVEWPSKEVRDEAWPKLMADPRMEQLKPPFDGQRMVFGGFANILDG